MLKRTILLLAIAAMSPDHSAQEGLRPLTGNPHHLLRHEPVMEHRSHQITARSQTVMLQLPFKEDFYYAPVSPFAAAEKWDESGVFVNTGFAIDPPSTGVATFDGLNRFGYPYHPSDPNMNASRGADTLTSKPINLQVAGTQTLFPSDSIGLIFYYQARGYGDKPEDTDSLVVDFFEPDSAVWIRVWSRPGLPPGAPIDSTFGRGFIRIADPLFLKPGFRFRFRNYATTVGDFDHWHVDYIYLNKNVNRNDTLFDDVTFAYVPTSLLHEYSAMPYNQYVSTEMTNHMLVKIRYNGAGTASMEYDHKVYQGNTEVHSYPGGPANLQAFHNNGYGDNAAHSDINIAAQYTLSPSSTDSSDYVIKHFITRNDQGASEFFAGNDTLYQYQRFRNYFAYDDGSAEAGYYMHGAGSRVAVQFRINQTDTLRGVRIYFDPVGPIGQLKTYGFRLLVWDAGANGPAALQHSFSTVYYPNYYDTIFRGIPEFRLDTPVVLTAGNYFIGLQQQANNVVIGFDRNYDAHSKVWVSSGQSWSPSSIEGSLMFRPVMGRKIGPPVGLPEVTEADFSLFPNPAAESVTLESKGDFVFSISDATGRLLMNGSATDHSTVDVSHFPPGLYLISINARGYKPMVRKLVISR